MSIGDKVRISPKHVPPLRKRDKYRLGIIETIRSDGFVIIKVEPFEVGYRIILSPEEFELES